MTILISGIVHEIQAPQQLSNGKQKQIVIFAIDTETQYPQYVPVEFYGNLVSQVPLRVGTMCEFFANLKGSAWNGKYFINLGFFRYAQQPQQQQAHVQSSAPVYDNNKDSF